MRLFDQVRSVPPFNSAMVGLRLPVPYPLLAPNAAWYAFL
jgi:hypothetical protein